MEKNLELSDSGLIAEYGSIALARQGVIGPNYYVDSGASDNNSGLSWASAKATIQAALDLCTGRGHHTVYVHSGAYQETLTTPVNATAPFCQLIGVDPTDVGYGVYLYPAAAGNDILTINARGWRISGFEFDPGTGAGVRFTRDADGANRSCFARIDHCHFTTGAYGIHTTGSPVYVMIDHNLFDSLTTAAIFAGGGDTSFASPLHWTIRHNEFRENVAHIKMGASWGLNASKIYKNIMQGTGGGNSAKDDAVIDIRGGTFGCNIVSQNILGISEADYDSGTGPCRPGTNDFWVGNVVTEGIMDELPAGG